MSTQLNKDIYNRFIEEGFNQGHLRIIDEILSPSYVNHDAPPGVSSGPDGVKQIITTFRNAFPDLKITIEAQIAEGDRVSSLTTMRGTHKGPLFGIPPTGKSVAMTGMTMVHVAGGCLVESWVKNDVMGLMSQLGAGKQ